MTSRSRRERSNGARATSPGSTGSCSPYGTMARSLSATTQVQSSGRPLGDIFSNPYMDVAETRDIRVTPQGRLAAPGSSRPSVTIGQFALGNISNVDLTVLLSAVEQQIEASDADEDVKEEARGKLHALRDLAEKTGTGAGGELIGSALANALRQLGVF
jgi:hypothetical protein